MDDQGVWTREKYYFMGDTFVVVWLGRVNKHTKNYIHWQVEG